MVGVNNMWCVILIQSKLTELFGIENFSFGKDSRKVRTIIIIYILIVNIVVHSVCFLSLFVLSQKR